MKLNVPHYPQEKSNTCGLAVLRMVFGYYGETVTEKKLEKQADMHSFGTFTTELARIARKRGYKVEAYTMFLPSIIAVNTAALNIYWKNWKNGHFFIVNEVPKPGFGVLDSDQEGESGTYRISKDKLHASLTTAAAYNSAYLLLIKK